MCCNFVAYVFITSSTSKGFSRKKNWENMYKWPKTIQAMEINLIPLRHSTAPLPISVFRTCFPFRLIEKHFNICKRKLSCLSSFFLMARVGYGFNCCHASIAVPRAIRKAMIENIALKWTKIQNHLLKLTFADIYLINTQLAMCITYVFEIIWHIFHRSWK